MSSDCFLRFWLVDMGILEEPGKEGGREVLLSIYKLLSDLFRPLGRHYFAGLVALVELFVLRICINRR